MIESPYFYLTLSFIGFLIILYRYAYQPLISFLDAHIARISYSFKQVEAQKETAKQTFQEEVKKCQKIDLEIEKILKNAEQKCEILRHNIKAEILAEIKEQDHRLKVIKEKMEHDFIYQLRDQISDQIIKSLSTWIEKNQDNGIQLLSQKHAIYLLQNLKSVS